MKPKIVYSPQLKESFEVKDVKGNAIYTKEGAVLSKNLVNDIDDLDLNLNTDEFKWIELSSSVPDDCEMIIGVEMPYECMYICHREGDVYVSDDTGEIVDITHWMYAPKPPIL